MMTAFFMIMGLLSIAALMSKSFRDWILESISMKGLALALGIFVLSPLAFGQEDAGQAPEWLLAFLSYISTIPKVGPILVEVAKWIGVITTAFTALSVAAQVVLKIPEVAARVSGAEELAEKIKKLNDTIQPYLKYLSIFNVQKLK